MKSPARTPSLLFAVSLVLLILGEALRVYWIMPMPGSQSGETLAWAYALHRAIPWLRVVFGLVAAAAAFAVFRRGSRLAKVLAALGIALLALIAYQANGPMSADVMFRQPAVLKFANAATASLAPAALVVGVELDGAGGERQARAYPVQLIGYHHQVRDQVAGRPVMVTYCTVCRTGRVFSPVVAGKVEEFRLVGMDHWNAMFEDATTGSWWRQANGEAVAGPLAGALLPEIPSRQMSWQAWLALHPDSTVMEPDPEFAEAYARLAGFAEGTNKGKLTGRNPESWQEKSWVVGVVAGGAARAFDWNELVKENVVADRVGQVPVVVLLGSDGSSFYAYDARPPGSPEPLELEKTADPGVFREKNSGELWNEQGRPLAATGVVQLRVLPAYQEFWHSWRTFHPSTTARRSPSEQPFRP